MIPVSPRFWWGIRNKSEDALRIMEALKEKPTVKETVAAIKDFVAEKHEEMVFFS